MEHGKNYMKLGNRSLFYRYYAIFDVKDYLADDVFIRHKVPVHFGPEFAREGSPYRVIICRVRKKHESEFLNAMTDLTKKMLLCGYPDYLDYATDLMEKMEAAYTDGRRDSLDTACAT